MEIVALFATAFGLGLSGAMMPGPLTTVSFTESARRGWLASPVVITGHFAAEFLMVVALAAGLSQILTQHWALGVIGVFGGAFLVWMGYGMLKGVLNGSVRLDLSAAKTGAAPSVEGSGRPMAASSRPNTFQLGLMVTGALVSVSNPYWLMWWATAGTKQLVDSLALGLIGPAVFLVGHVSSDYAWNGLLGIAAFSGRRFISDRVYAGVIAACALFVAAIGLMFMYDGLDRWFAIGSLLPK